MYTLFENSSVISGAEFSLCGKYRYKLWRIWDEALPLIMFIGLNPSTANATEPDPTIKSVTRITEFNGYGGFYMMNLFTIISSKPEILDAQSDLANFFSDEELLIETAKKCQSVVFAW